MSSDVGQPPSTHYPENRGQKVRSAELGSAAVYVDFENIFRSLSHCDDPTSTFALPFPIMRALNRILARWKLQPRMRRAYAKWTVPYLVQSDSQTVMTRFGYCPIHTTGKAGSNAAEIQLMIDMIAEMAQNGNHYDYFVIVSGDNDIAPAVRKLKELGTVGILVIYATDESLGLTLRAEADECLPLDYLYKEFVQRFPKTSDDLAEQTDDA